MSTPALLALDRLNRYARCWDNVVQPGLIYAFKDAALLRLWDEGLHGWRRVAYQVPICGHCGGTGWHLTERHDRRAEGCHRCWGHGSTKGSGLGPVLQFVESTIRIDDGRELVWHSPVSGDGAGIALWNRLWPSEVGGVGTWKPRQPGEPMPAHEVARDLLTVEDWLGPVEWQYGWQLRIPKDSVAAEHPDVVAWHRRHPIPPTWLSAMQTVTSGTAPEIAEKVDDVPF